MTVQYLPVHELRALTQRLADGYPEVAGGAVVEAVHRAYEGLALLGGGLPDDETVRLVEAAARNEIVSLTGETTSRPRLDPVRSHTRPSRRRR